MAGLSSYKNYVGLAKVTMDGFAAAAVASGATSVTVAGYGGSLTSSDSVIFLDGPNTEVCSISAFATEIATISATTKAHPAGCYLLFQPTASIGATAYIPLTSFTVPDKVDQLYDTSYRGVLAKQVGVVQGMRSAEWSIGGNVFFDTFGYLLGGFWGAEDFAAGPPDTHAFSTLNTNNGQPAKYAFYVYDGVNTRIVVGRISGIDLKYDPKALLTHTTKIMANASGVVANGTTSYTTVPTAGSWRASLTIGGGFQRNPLSFDLSLGRDEAEAIPTMNGTQDPYDNFVGAATCTVKVSFVKEDDGRLNDYLTGTQETLVLSLSQGTGSGATGLAVQITEANYDSVEPKLQGKSYNTEDASLTAIANATDATSTGGGLSPCKITLTNSTGTGAYT